MGYGDVNSLTTHVPSATATKPKGFLNISKLPSSNGGSALLRGKSTIVDGK